MIAATTFAGRKVAIFGLGLSGVAAARALAAGGADVVAFDDNEKACAAAGAQGIAVENLATADFAGLAALVLAPGVPLTHPKPHWVVRKAQQAGVEVLGDTEIFCRERRKSFARTKLLAITGTNGKSTTTALTHHLLACLGVDAVLGGNIGEAVLGLPPFADGRVYVLELSSFQLDLTPTLDADGAVLLNVTTDHLDRHGTMDNYAAVKAKVFSRLAPAASAVVGADDGYCDAIANRLSAEGKSVLRVSARTKVKTGIFAEGAELFEVVGGKVMNRASLAGIGSLRGAHNAQNAAAALGLARSLGYPFEVLAGALSSFRGLPHRMEEVGRRANVLFINDSKATNADAAECALASFSSIYWILGGKPKAGGIATLERYFPKIKKAYLIGQAAPAFAKTLDGKAAFSMSGTLDVALEEAARDALASGEEEAAVLLSPACASYDQFANFEQRGDAFRAAVHKLLAVSEGQRP